MNRGTVSKLKTWKHDLKVHKAGEMLNRPYEGVRLYQEMPGMDQLLFDGLSDALDAFTDEKTQATGMRHKVCRSI